MLNRPPVWSPDCSVVEGPNTRLGSAKSPCFRSDLFPHELQEPNPAKMLFCAEVPHEKQGIYIDTEVQDAPAEQIRAQILKYLHCVYVNRQVP